MCCLFIRFNICSPESDIRQCVCVCVCVCVGVCMCVCVYRGVYGVWEEAEYVAEGAI